MRSWYWVGSCRVGACGQREGRILSSLMQWVWSTFDACQTHCCCSVMSDSLWPHELQHSRFSCPSLSPGVYSSSCPLSQWCRSTISSSVAPFSSSCIRVFCNELAHDTCQTCSWNWFSQRALVVPSQSILMSGITHCAIYLTRLNVPLFLLITISFSVPVHLVLPLDTGLCLFPQMIS